MNMTQTPSADGVRSAPSSGRSGRRAETNRRRRRFIGWGSATTALAVAAQTLGHVQAIEHFAIDAFHWSIFRNADMLLRIGVPIAVAGGVALLIYGFVFHAKERRREQTVVLAAVALLVTSSAAYASLRWLPKTVTVNDYLKDEATERTKRLLAYQVTSEDPVGHSTGGLRVTSDSTQPQQVWATAQSLKGILSSSARLDADDVERIRSAFTYIENQFVPEQGWGYFDEWQTGVTEVAGWVGLAQIASLDRTAPAIWTPEQLPAARASAERTLQLLASKQNAAEGGWSPNIGDPSPDFLRTYSTAVATWALIEARRSPALRASVGTRYDDAIRKGISWLLANYNPVLGWVPNPTRKVQNEAFIGLEAQVLFILGRAERDFAPYISAQPNALAAKQDFLARVQPDRGLSDNNRMHDGDRYLQHAAGTPSARAVAPVCGCQFTVEASTFLWYPWSLATARALANDRTLTADQRERARQVASTLGQRTAEAASWLDREFHYVTAEFLVGTTEG
jgi:hypothetical protein